MKSILFYLLISITFSYKNYEALSYASYYCDHHNPDFPDYSTKGGDSANFISQCMLAGWENFDGCPGLDSAGVFKTVAALKNCLKLKGWNEYDSKPKNFKIGYPVFMRGLSHAMIATGFMDEYVYVASHTPDKCRDLQLAEDLKFYSK